MKLKLFSIVAVALMAGGTVPMSAGAGNPSDSVSVQKPTRAERIIKRWTSKTDRDKIFDPHWYIELEDGASWCFGQYNQQNKMRFFECLSNLFMVGGGYNFTPLSGVRLTVGYGQGRGVVNGYNYAYQLTSPMVDYMLNLSNLFSGYRHDRAIDMYAYVGLGCHVGCETNNNKLPEVVNNLDRAWKAPAGFFTGRAGALARIRLTDKMSVLADLNVDCSSDKLNSKTDPWWHKAGNKGGWDGRFNMMVGVAYRLDSKYRSLAQVLATASASTALADLSLIKLDSTVYDATKVIEEARKASANATAASAEANDAAAYAAGVAQFTGRDDIQQLADEAVLAANLADSKAAVSLVDADNTAAAVAVANKAADNTRAVTATANKILGGNSFNKTLTTAAAKDVDAAVAVEETAVVALNDIKLTTVASTATTCAAVNDAVVAAERCRNLALEAFQEYCKANSLNSCGKFEKDVFFDLDSSYFNPKGWTAVLEVAQWLTNHPEEKMLLTGYASAESAGDAYNLWLSNKRVTHVYEWLQKLGIPADRLETDYKGERVQPFEFNDDNRVVTCRQK